jgi:hypothetical protein
MPNKSGGAAGGGKQDAQKKGKAKGGGLNKEQGRRTTGKMQPEKV